MSLQPQAVRENAGVGSFMDRITPDAIQGADVLRLDRLGQRVTAVLNDAKNRASQFGAIAKGYKSKTRRTATLLRQKKAESIAVAAQSRLDLIGRERSLAVANDKVEATRLANVAETEAEQEADDFAKAADAKLRDQHVEAMMDIAANHFNTVTGGKEMDAELEGKVRAEAANIAPSGGKDLTATQTDQMRQIVDTYLKPLPLSPEKQRIADADADADKAFLREGRGLKTQLDKPDKAKAPTPAELRAREDQQSQISHSVGLMIWRAGIGLVHDADEKKLDALAPFKEREAAADRLIKDIAAIYSESMSEKFQDYIMDQIERAFKLK